MGGLLSALLFLCLGVGGGVPGLELWPCLPDDVYCWLPFFIWPAVFFPPAAVLPGSSMSRLPGREDPGDDVLRVLACPGCLETGDDIMSFRGEIPSGDVPPF